MLRRLAPATALSLILTTPAFADLTAAEVWTNWKQIVAENNMTLDIAEEETGSGRLTIRGLTITTDPPENGFTATLGELVLEENGDGTVALRPSQPYGIRFDGLPAEEGDMVIEMELRHEGLQMIASGTPDAINYDFGANRLTLASVRALENGEPFDLTFALGMDQMSGQYAVTGSDPQAHASLFETEALAFTLKVSDPEQQSSADMELTVQGLTAESEGTLSPFAGSGPNVAAMLKAGHGVSGTTETGPAAYRLQASTGGDSSLIEASSQSSYVETSLSADGLRYTGENAGNVITVTQPGAVMPPMTFSIARTSGDIMIPVMTGEGPESFDMKLSLEDLELPEMLWSMVDMAGVLPRDPADLDLEISGTGDLSVDLLDTDGMIALGESGAAPGALDSIAIDRLRLSAVGAELIGTGAFDFDTSNQSSMPEGRVDMTLVGGNALLDNLVTIGILPQDQAMGFRMMLGLFARQVEGEDKMTSTIEVKRDGAILANGQRIR